MLRQLKVPTISVIGLGYIGLPTAAIFASRKIKVIGVDINQHVVDTINQGLIHIVEPELGEIVKNAVADGFLYASTNTESADVFLIAVPTPFKEDHLPDLSYIRAAVESIAPVLKKGDMVILESTSPVGTTEKMLEWLTVERPDLSFPVKGASVDSIDINLAYCPERVLPGHAIRELVENDRIIGGLSTACSKKAADIYRIFVEGELLFTNARTAEMAKLTENAFRDVNIAFANELSLISEKLDINVWELIKLANRHPRVNILQPGCGVGGHCIAVDPWFMVKRTPQEARLIRTAREVNDNKPVWVWGKIKSAIDAQTVTGRDEASIKVALLGLAFKPNIDDMRDSPALRVAELVATQTRCRLMIVEPNIEKLPSSLNSYSLMRLEDALAQADLVVILVAHHDFTALPCLSKRGSAVLDVVGLLDGHND